MSRSLVPGPEEYYCDQEETMKKVRPVPPACLPYPLTVPIGGLAYRATPSSSTLSRVGHCPP